MDDIVTFPRVYEGEILRTGPRMTDRTRRTKHATFVGPRLGDGTDKRFRYLDMSAAKSL